MKFKIGDKIIGSSNSQYHITGKGWKGIIVNTHSTPTKKDDDIEIKSTTGKSPTIFAVNSDYFELDEEPDEETEFKIGDKVKIAKGICEGTTGIIKRIEGDIIYADWSDGDATGSMPKKDLEIIPPEPEKPNPEELELTLPPKIRELLIKKLPELIKKKYITDEFKITEKGQEALLKIFTKL